jgi:hypothetical protein
MRNSVVKCKNAACTYDVMLAPIDEFSFRSVQIHSLLTQLIVLNVSLHSVALSVVSNFYR